MRAWASLVLSFGSLFFSLIGSQASGQAPSPLEASVQLAPGKMVRIAAVREGDGWFLVAEGKRAPLPVRDATKIEASVVSLAKGRNAAVVTISAAGGARAGGPGSRSPSSGRSIPAATPASALGR